MNPDLTALHHFLLVPGEDLAFELYLAGEGSSCENIRAIDRYLGFSSEEICFGHIFYELKNEIENGIILSNEKKQFLKFSRGKKTRFLLPDNSVYRGEPITFKHRTTKKEYLRNVSALLEHIHRGDIYEINYCIEFFAEKQKIDPVHVFFQLQRSTKAPHACLYKDGSQWLICASPERFLKRTGNRLISQPIKGTRPRGKNEQEDRALVNELKSDPKERSENIMIVDLVRNDLSRVARKGSVQVEELCGIHSFPTIHQMISTVSANLREKVTFSGILNATFPMGSMTGAPKIRAMQLIDQYENMTRGIYSGSVGVIHPNGDFDLNVVIRSIEYNDETGYLAIKAGSAITAHCNPEKEYAECLVKAESLLKALNASLE